LFFGGKTNFLEEQLTFLRGTYVLNFLAMIIISGSFLYRLVTYHWKVLEKNYNYVVEGISIKIHMQKLRSNKVLNTFVPQGTWLLPQTHGWAQ
jgi:hypothetical protein